MDRPSDERNTVPTSTEQLSAASKEDARGQTPAGDTGVPVIYFEGVHKIYDLGEVQVHALRGLDVTIHRGEFVAIMGASGGGKSTFMNLDGVDVSTLDKSEMARIRNKKLGFVFQGFNLLSRTTALENVELPALYARLPAEERVERAREALRIVGLGDREDHFPSQLSGGQQQRVAIARALINQPSILLADEPTGNLDSRTSVEIMGIFQRLNRERGITLVLVTHEPDIAEYAQRIITFRDGKIRRDERVAHPADAEQVLKTMPVVGSDED